ncbi:MAG: radical SAM protein [Nitrospirota bacterium]|nr:radical SAM protein [Nitrospirota bacterium]
MLLINPPVAKPGEAPAGIARLSGALRAHGIRHQLLDASLEGLLHLLKGPQAASDTWTRRAWKNRESHLLSLKNLATYRSPDKYRRAVLDLERVLATASSKTKTIVGLANYHDADLMPHKTSDLLLAAEKFRESPFYHYYEQRLATVMAAGGHDIVGVSLNYLSQALPAFSMIGFIKQRFPQVRIILGGGLVTSWMRGIGRTDLFSGLVEKMVAGPGEQELLKLHGMESCNSSSYQPDYSGLPMEQYLSPGTIVPYSGSSGCWWNKCSFCPEKAEGNPYVPVPAEMLISQLQGLVKQPRTSMVHLLDNAVSIVHMKALIADPPGAPWYGFARAGNELADEQFCRQLRRAGCVMLKLGLESGDQQVLDALGKGMDLGVASKTLRALRKAGIATFVYLIFGTPQEDRPSALKTMEFTAEHSDAIDFLNLAIFNMPVCGDEARQYGIRTFTEGDLSLYTDFRHPKAWDRKEVRRFLDAEFKAHPSIRPIINRDLPIFGSNHAAFFSLGCHENMKTHSV